MFRVTADSLAAYLDFDPERKPDLVRLDALIRATAPTLKRCFHRGTPAGEAGMRMKMIGYGKFRYAIKSGKSTQWPVIGGALQKNYISVYVAVTRIGSPIVWAYAGKLGELRMGGNNFSFERFDDLCTVPLSSLFAEVAGIFRSDPLKSRSIHAGDVIQNRHCEEPEGRRSNPLIFATEMDCFAALVIGPATSGRTRWLAMTPHESDLKSSCH